MDAARNRDSAPPPAGAGSGGNRGARAALDSARPKGDAAGGSGTSGKDGCIVLTFRWHPTEPPAAPSLRCMVKP